MRIATPTPPHPPFFAGQPTGHTALPTPRINHTGDWVTFGHSTTQTGQATQTDFETACRQAGTTPSQAVLQALQKDKVIHTGPRQIICKIPIQGLEDFVVRTQTGVPTDHVGLNRHARNNGNGHNSHHTNGNGNQPDPLAAGSNILSEAELKPANSNHPWRDRKTVSLPLAKVGDFYVQRFIPGRTAASYIEDGLTTLANAQILLGLIEQHTKKTPWEQIAEIDLSAEYSNLWRAYQQFEHQYTRYVALLANMPQAAYDEVAEMMVEGYENHTGIDLSNAGNIMLMDTPADNAPENPADKEHNGRFGFVKTYSLLHPDVDPVAEPMTMAAFVNTLLNNGPERLTDDDLKQRIMNPELKEAYLAHLKTIHEKAKAAKVKHQVFRARSRFTHARQALVRQRAQQENDRPETATPHGQGNGAGPADKTTNKPADRQNLLARIGDALRHSFTTLRGYMALRMLDQATALNGHTHQHDHHDPGRR